jgi:hypothetical protein
MALKTPVAVKVLMAVMAALALKVPTALKFPVALKVLLILTEVPLNYPAIPFTFKFPFQSLIGDPD